jgi:hypothetical protein
MTLCDRLAAFLQARPGQWVDGERLAQVAGKYAWRSRCSDLRKAPYHLTIVNRQRRLVSSTGRTYKVSEYKLDVSHDAPRTSTHEGAHFSL